MVVDTIRYKFKELFSQLKFEEKKHTYRVKNKYAKEYIPTIDRINCMDHYALNNIQCLPWSENRYKQRMEFKRIRAKKVYQIKDGKVIKVYKSVSEAVKYAHVRQGNLSSCLHGRRQLCGNYNWSYENPGLLESK